MMNYKRITAEEAVNETNVEAYVAGEWVAVDYVVVDKGYAAVVFQGGGSDTAPIHDHIFRSTDEGEKVEQDRQFLSNAYFYAEQYHKNSAEAAIAGGNDALADEYSANAARFSRVVTDNEESMHNEDTAQACSYAGDYWWLLVSARKHRGANSAGYQIIAERFHAEAVQREKFLYDLSPETRSEGCANVAIRGSISQGYRIL